MGGIAFAIVWLVVGAISASHAVMYKRDPRAATIWVIVSFFVPLVGPWLYWVMGINRVARRARTRLGRRERPFGAPGETGAVSSARPLNAPLTHLASLRTVADRVTRLPILGGNTVEPLHNGDRAYPAMLDAIRAAKHTVTLASYIFDWDDVGRAFCRALGEVAGRGVRVCVLLDGLGAIHSNSRAGRLLLKSGARVAAFFPLRFPLGRIRINLRNHRKLLVVDGRVGFTGGMNVSERHLVDGGDAKRVEDLHFRVTGPVVAELQHAFAEDWALAADEELTGDAFFPALSSTGSARCRGISSGPDEDFEIIHRILQAALASAVTSVRIMTPYFVPTWPLISSMQMASLRGVDVRLLLPSVVDRPFMRWAADAYLWQLLGHGVRVYHHPPPFVHTKLLIVDGVWLLIGSANLDNRSFRLNFEFNVEVYDERLGASLSTWFDERMGRALEVTLREMDARPTWRRLRDGIVKMASPFL